MTPDSIADIGRETIEVALMMAGPVLACALAAGLLVSLLQAVTRVAEPTLTFVPKLIAVMVAIIVLLPWMMDVMVGFTSRIIAGIPGYIG